MQVTAVRERIVLADALRGFALMGLFIVHMVEYFELYWYRPEPGWIHNLVFFVFGGKAYGMFALLFGLSFFIILDNYAKRGVDFRARFVWRITLLLAFGYLHSLLYAGDILQVLAVCGLLLVVCYRLSQGWLIAIAIFFLLQVPQFLIIALHNFAPDPNYQQPAFWNLMGANFQVFANGSFSELLQHNLFDGQKGKWAFFLETGRLWNIFGLMFVGLLLGRNSFFEKVHSVKNLCLLMFAALLLFFIFNLVQTRAGDPFSTTMANWAWKELLGYYQNLCIIVIEVALFVLLFQTALGNQVLATLAPAGRMTLSFYILQSLVFVPAYYGFGLAWYSSLGQGWSLVLGFAFWTAQMILASWYTQRFRYGPAEWLWRRGTLAGFSSR